MRNLIKAGCVVLVLSLSPAAPVAAGPFEDGVAAYKSGDYATALRLFRPLANQGDAFAQYNLGVMYDKGQGMPQDYAEAMRWYRKAAQESVALAEYNLGLMYEKGQGVPQDYAEATRWYRKAADQGDAFAQYNLGLTYADGRGVPQDYAEAMRWYRKAAEQGVAFAQYSLGVMYANGRGVPQDYTEAVPWYRRAAEQGHAAAQTNLGLMYAKGWGVPQDYVQAHKWFSLAAARFPASEAEDREKAVTNRDLIAAEMTAAQIEGVSSVLLRAGVEAVPKANVAVFVGTEFDVLAGRGGKDEPRRKTPWGEIAWQLGGADSFAAVAQHDAEGIAPGGDVIRKMLPVGPSLVLIDELLNYASRARKKGLSGQLYDFLQNLSEEARARDRLVLCVSIPASELEMNPEDQRDYDSFKKLLDRLGKAVSMSTEGEVTEIIRRRLFEWSGLPDEGRQAGGGLMATPSAARERGDGGKVKLYLAKPTPAALAELYKRLTGRPLSAEGLKQLREITREDNMSCEICGTTEDLRSMQTSRPAPVVLCRACAYVAGTDPRTVLALVNALVGDPALASLFPRRRRS